MATIEMRDWDGSGAIVGYWKSTEDEEETLLDMDRGRGLYSDYVPHNLRGHRVATALGTNDGYWQMHVPVSNRSTTFHRQLLQDFLNNPLLGQDAHHGLRGIDYNTTADLAARPSGPHRATHGREGGQASSSKGRGRGPGGAKRKRPW